MMTILLCLGFLVWSFVGVWHHLQGLKHTPGGLRAGSHGRHWQREMRRWERGARRRDGAGPAPTREDIDAYRAERHAGTHVGFFIHLLAYLGVTALLACINLMSSSYPWFFWPAIGWGFGLFAHWLGVFGRDAVITTYQIN